MTARPVPDVPDTLGRIDALPIARSQAEVEAFEALFRAHYTDVCAYVRRFVRSRALAEELAQDVFARIWERHDAVDPARNARGYLLTAAKRHALNYLSREGFRARHAAWEDWRGRESEPSVADAVEDRELEARVSAAVARLPHQAQTVWRLRREREMSYADIARELGLSVKTVERHMGRAFKQLRASLAGYLTAAIVAVLVR